MLTCELCGESFKNTGYKSTHKRNQHPVTREKLLEDIHRVRDLLGQTPTCKDYREHGGWSPKTVADIFGTWSQGLEAAGYRPRHRDRIPDAELLNHIRQLAEEIDRTPTVSDMRSMGATTVSSIQDRFGSWNEGLRQAGFEINSRVAIPESELLNEIGTLAEKLGHVPTGEDMAEHGQFSIRPYFNRWDGWQDAVRAAGYEPVGYPTGPDNHKWKPDVEYGVAYYGSNWDEQRAEVLARDGYSCQYPNCGTSNEAHQERFSHGLHVHHIRPLTSFLSDGEIEYEEANASSNLITVCLHHHPRLEQMSPLLPDTRK